MISHLPLRIAASLFTLGIVLQPTAGHCAPSAVAKAPVLQMPHISVVATGRGSPVILIPGLSSPRAVWDGVVPDLARSHRVYVVQVNGFGGDAPGDNLKPGILDGVVADLETLIVREKLGKPAIVGHSMGGLVSLMFAKAHPDHVGRLMIVDSLPLYGALFAPTATVDAVRPQAAAMRDMLVATAGDPAKRAANAERTANGLAATPDARAKVKAWGMAADPRVTGQAMYEDLTTDLRPDMAKITAPITLVYPWSDALPKAVAEGLYKREYGAAPHVTFVDVPNAAHFVMLDQPKAFADALDTFLR